MSAATSTSNLPKRYLDPKIDLAFKRVFGEHANLLKSFLNALLPLPADGQIESLEYLTPDQVPENPLFKFSIVDVKCIDQQGRVFLVEMQMMWTATFEARMVFGASQAYVKQLKVGHSYSELRPVYALALINDVFLPNDANYYHHYRIVNVEQPKHTLKGLEFVLIELPKFKAETRTGRRLQTLWLRFLRETGVSTSQAIDPELTNEADIAQALHLVELSAFTEAELESYHVGLDRARTEMAVIHDARAEGKAEGKAEGRAEGKAEGEHTKAQAIAQALLADGLGAERVAALTGLTLQELHAL